MPGFYANDWSNYIQQMPDQGPSVGGPVGGVDNSFGNLFTPSATQELGGFNNPTQGPGLEQWQDQRLGKLGASTNAADIPAWMKTQQGAYDKWAQQSSQGLSDAYDQALAQYNGGTTPAQQALTEQQGAQSGAMQSLARSATGGARGAAAAQGNAQQLGAGTQAGQANAMTQQQLADKYAAADLMQSIGNQQRGLAQGEYNLQGTRAGNEAAYKQGWNATNDQAALWADTMKKNRSIADLGYQTGAASINNQNQQFYQNIGNQILGSGVSAGGAIGAGIGSYNGGGGGGYQDSYSNGIYHQDPYS